MAAKSEKEIKRPAGTRRGREVRAATAKKFLARYQEAWETRNADLAASLFTRDAHYWENPFGEPIVGREAVRAYWHAATDRQEDIHFSVTNSFHHKYTLVAEWTCHYRHKPSGESRELAGMLFADFYGEQVRTFREYWHRRAR
ncbi:MAG: nuclear transport factor 2 family protein [Acidobacteriia bacterium]|nr:nuclear transport factor 2 family protein [Terriglobia bacterium]